MGLNDESGLNFFGNKMIDYFKKYTYIKFL